MYRQLSKLNIPTCIIWGSLDCITPSNAADTLTTFFGKDNLHILQNVGHLPFVEDSLTVAALIENHFRGRSV